MSKHLRNAVAYICLAALGAACGTKEASAPRAGVVAGQDEEQAKPKGELATPKADASKDPSGSALAGADMSGVVGGTVGRGQGVGSRGVGGGGGGGKAGRYAGPSGYAGSMPSRPPARPEGGERDRDGQPNSEDYAHLEVNKLTLTEDDRLSTFAVDVDTASYSLARRKLLGGQAVPQDSVRVEEFVNYFNYAYAAPSDGRPFAVHMEAAPSPYAKGRYLLRVGVQGKHVAKRDRKKANLVFLVDVSGSMNAPDRLPLAQRSLRILVDNLGEHDTVSLVTYAGSTRVVLPPTSAGEKGTIYAAIDDLSAGGSTAMSSGIELAYGLAVEQLAPDAETRVIVLSDGDANVGNSSHEEILKTISGHVKEGVTLSTIGFGVGNYRDRLMEQLANKGNGNNYYIDGLSQAKRVFQEQLGGTLEVIAQDVKIQVDFDPKAVKAYRLVGYENRDVADNDFRNDKVDAGEIGAGHSVTAIYEIELATAVQPQLATVRLRAKKPRGNEAAEYTYAFSRALLRPSFEAASEDFRFAAAVAGFAEILRKSPYADGWKLDTVLTIGRAATPKGNEEREEFLTLVSKAPRSS